MLHAHGSSLGRSPLPFALLVLGTVAISACSEALTGSRGEHPTGEWASVSVGGSFVCGTTTDMRSYCWGDNTSGQLGAGLSVDGPESCGTPCSTRPVAVAGDFRFASVSAGDAHACGLTPEGLAYCWGSNARGQLGSRTTETCFFEPCSTRPLRVSGNLAWSSITAGRQHTCGVTQAGAAYCWGSNVWGRLGNGVSTETGSVSAPVPVVGGLTFQVLSAGAWHTCGLTTDDRAFCWGMGRTGELGSQEAELFGGGWAVRPALVAGGHTFATISVGGHSCGVTTSQRAYCWGSNTMDQLGVGPTMLGPESCTATVHPCATTPAAVAGGLRFSDVSAGPLYACAVATNGEAYCWGENTWGQVGNGSSTLRVNAPTPVTGRLQFRALSTGGTVTIAGTAGVTCGVTVRGAAYCWGANRHGELGSGAWTAADDDPPGRTVPGLVAAPRQG